MKRVRVKKNIDFNYDSLADIVCNIVGILIILGVMVGLLTKSESRVKDNYEKEVINGKKDAMTDIIKPDKRLNLPIERESRYNRFHVHVICFGSRLYFVDTSEMSLLFFKGGYLSLMSGIVVDSCRFTVNRDDLARDNFEVTPIEGKGLALPDESVRNEVYRDFFKLMPQFSKDEKRAKTQLLPNNHAVHFHVFPDSIEIFKNANDYLRMLGFDTGWSLHQKKEKGSIKLPAYLQEHQHVKRLYIQ